MCRRWQARSNPRDVPPRPLNAPFFVTEQFAFDQCVRKSSAIHGEKRTGSTRAQVVDGARCYFFSRACFATDQDGGFRGAAACSSSAKTLRIDSDWATRPPSSPRVESWRSRRSECFASWACATARSRMVWGALACAGFSRYQNAPSSRTISMARSTRCRTLSGDCRRWYRKFLEFREQARAIEVGHAEVCDDGVRVETGELFESVATILRGECLMAPSGQQVGHGRPLAFVIVDDQNASFLVFAHSSNVARWGGRKVFWSWRRGLNPRPSDYKSNALPAELRQLRRRTPILANRRPAERLVKCAGSARLSLTPKSKMSAAPAAPVADAEMNAYSTRLHVGIRHDLIDSGADSLGLEGNIFFRFGPG